VPLSRFDSLGGIVITFGADDREDPPDSEERSLGIVTNPDVSGRSDGPRLSRFAGSREGAGSSFERLGDGSTDRRSEPGLGRDSLPPSSRDSRFPPPRLEGDSLDRSGVLLLPLPLSVRGRSDSTRGSVRPRPNLCQVLSWRDSPVSMRPRELPPSRRLEFVSGFGRSARSERSPAVLSLLRSGMVIVRSGVRPSRLLFENVPPRSALPRPPDGSIF